MRLVKGIWIEPPQRAFGDPDVVRGNYLRLLEELLSAGGFAAIASHDEWIHWRSLELIDRLDVAADRYEFQMLLGCASSSVTHSWQTAIPCASTCPTAATGTSTRCGASRRTRSSHSTWPQTSSTGRAGAWGYERGQVRRPYCRGDGCRARHRTGLRAAAGERGRGRGRGRHRPGDRGRDGSPDRR